MSNLNLDVLDVGDSLLDCIDQYRVEQDNPEGMCCQFTRSYLYNPDEFLDNDFEDFE